jgi:hypothetical protein
MMKTIEKIVAVAAVAAAVAVLIKRKKKGRIISLVDNNNYPVRTTDVAMDIRERFYNREYLRIQTNLPEYLKLKTEQERESFEFKFWTEPERGQIHRQAFP